MFLFPPQIMDGLRFQIHKQYNEFIKRHPDFQPSGTISLFAHSLGSVMVFDLLQETCEARGVPHEEPPECLLAGQPVSGYESFKGPPQEGASKALDMQGSGRGGVRFTAGVESSESSLRSDLSPLGEDEPGVWQVLLYTE